MLRPLYNWVLRLAESRYALPIMGLVAIVDLIQVDSPEEKEIDCQTRVRRLQGSETKEAARGSWPCMFFLPKTQNCLSTTTRRLCGSELPVSFSPFLFL